ncbi:SusC/RagA family TonB-linked outer membrane protein [Saccharicrinis fermentans]|nr:SusC/RagA family TonB-linked outer membrane protein [Saccharicrinis fermentans]
MKIQVVIMMFLSLQVSASVLSQKTVNLQLVDVTLKDCIAAIEEQTQLGFLYNGTDLEQVVGIDLNAKNRLVEEVLEEILYPEGYSFSIKNNVILIKKELESNAKIQLAKRFIIKGKVSDENGDPVPGVNVVCVRYSTGTISQGDGTYELSVPHLNVALEFTFIGFHKQTIEVDGRTVINVQMETEVSEVDEVVVTGIFNRHAESFTGAVVTVKSDNLQRVANSNVFESIKNLDPSLNIASDFDLGSDPNKMPEIQLRGTSTFPGDESGDLRGDYQDSPNQPLFILDGFESNTTTIFDLDMERVSSITVFKDAAAKAIYGSKAANGVVVIETKRPETGTIRATYSGNVNIQAPDLTSYNLTNAVEKLTVEKLAGDYEHSQIGGLLTKEALYNERMKSALEGDDTYWLAAPTQVGIGTKHAISVEVGEQKTKIMANLSYNDVKGVMKESGRQNIAGSLSVDYRHKSLMFRNIMSVNANNSEDSPYGSFSEYAKMNPYWAAYNEDGSIATGDDYSNPLYNATINTTLKDSYFEFRNNLYVEWTMAEGLRLTTRIGVTKKNSEAHQFYPANHTKFDDYSEVDYARKGSYQLNNGSLFNLAGDMNLQYSKVFNEKHFFMSNIGFNLSSKVNNEVVNYAEGFPSDRMNDITFALQYAEGKTPYGRESNVRDVGLLAVFGYAYDNRFLSDVTIRQSGSSLFGADNRWGTFYSLGLGWNMHRETFLENSTWLKQLKIRSSIGTTGNQNFDSYQSLSTYSYYLDRTYDGELGSYVKSLANENLKWQTKLDFNVGVDMRIARLSLAFDYYQSITENLITSLSIPYSTGYSTVLENIGKVKNEGFELALNWQVMRSKNGFLNLTFSGVTNTNTILGLSDAMKEFNKTQDELASQLNYGKPVVKYVEGGSMTSIWAVPSLGIDPATGREIYVKQDGTITYDWDALDQVVVGNSLPKYRGNIGVNGEYKGFGFSFTARFLGGSEMYNSTLVNKVENIDTEYNVDKRVFDGRWTTPGQNAPYKILGSYYDQDINAWVTNPKTNPTSRFVQARNELTISSATVYYEFKRKLVREIGMHDLKLSAYMNDIYTFSSIQIERGTSYPFARTISLSLRATF